MKLLLLADKGTGKARKKSFTVYWSIVPEIAKYENVIHTEKIPTKEQIDNCDLVYCHTPQYYMNYLKHIKKPLIAFINDLWHPNAEGKFKNRLAYEIDKYCDCLFVRYEGAWIRSNWYKKWKRPWYYIPHCIDPELFNDWKQEKDIELLSVGQLRNKKKYHLRRSFVETFEDRENFYRLSQGKFIGKDFSKVINRAIITGSSNIPPRIFAKSFEIPASMSLLACDSNLYMEKAGFRPDENFIDINADNMKEKILYYLKHPNKIKEMTLKGYELVHRKHTIQQRAKEIFKNIDDFMGV